ncbi:Tetratricopeptide repeat-containing protein [Salegentibacter agarivorans]|uniref:Tetratricopeptide repeat-containing protein n=1 Tax=Salegentibacter agarivorans TaxID=345907 RepID=A0A1I2MVG8_9FLAO|nr:tetratricopeptide repeat protein [Salegentibacter agarivorans]SFF94900.1 Tetratricopeptide repeat-containing protein [Salegentibacter agarivorans]
MTPNKILLFVVLIFFSFKGISQRSANYTHDLAEFNKALELYNNQQFLAAQNLFDEVKEQTDDEKIEGDCAYYIANAAVRLNQPGADRLMERFVSRYPTSTKTNSAYLDVADYYFQTGKYSLARKWYDKVDEKSMSRAERERYYFNNGYAYFRAKQYDQARTYLERVRDSQEFGSQAKYYIGYMAYEGDDYEEANQNFEAVRSNDRYSEDLSYFQADMNFKLGNFEEAIKLAKEQLQSSNRIERSQLNKIIGESYFNLEQYEEALPYLKEYDGERGKWNNTDYYQLGYAYYKQGDYEKAISEFNKIIDGKNEIAQNAYYHLAQSYLESNQKQQALNAFKNASEMDFNSQIQEDAYMNYAKLSYEIGNSYESPSQVLINYIEKYPESENREAMESLLIDSFLTSGNFEEAMRLLENNRNFSDKQAYQKVAYYYGLQLYEEGDYERAINNFEKALSEPRDQKITAKATFWKAESEYNINRIDDAIIGYREFSGMNAAQGTDELENLDYNLGYAYFKKNEYSRAIEFFKRYSANGSSDVARRNDALLRLGDTYFVSSQYWPAIEAYDEALSLSGDNDYAAFQKAMSYGFIDRRDTKISDLKSFINQYSRSSFRDDAMYELGNTYVAANNISEALSAYDRLIREVPQSAFVPKAMLRQALIHYNADNGNRALERLKKVVNDYPNTPEAMQAVSTARMVYVDLGRTDEYASWVQNIDFVEVTDADLDNTTYESAENQYFKNEYDRAISGFENYLQRFPNGIHSINANFYLGQMYFRNGNKQKAAANYRSVANKPKNEFTEDALSRLSEILLENKNYREAVSYLERLEKEASSEQNVIFAQSNLMKSYLELDQPEKAATYADKVLANSESDSEARNDARVIVARAAFASGNMSKAKNAYSEVQKTAKGELAAEALYYDAYFKNESGNYEASNAAVQILAKDFSGYKRWGAKGLVLMADNFYELDDAYQATYILENVINNFSNYPEIVQEAKQELSRIKTEEAKTNSSVEANN